MGRKFGGLSPFGGGGAGSPSNTMRPGPRPTCVPSFILIWPTVWPQCTNVTDRQDRQRSDSIWRTILQTVAQKVRLIPEVFKPKTSMAVYDTVVEAWMQFNYSRQSRTCAEAAPHLSGKCTSTVTQELSAL